MVQFYRGIAGKRGSKIKGVVIHNDASYWSAEQWANYLPRHNAVNGFAHYYVDHDSTYQLELEEHMAWHTGHSEGNTYYIGIEVCQSYGELGQFQKAEERAFKLAADILKRHGLTANQSTVRLHNEFFATACPHRSQEIHGSGKACQNYFISKVKSYLNSAKRTAKTHDQAIAESPVKIQNGYAGKLEFLNVKGNQFVASGWLTGVNHGTIGHYGYILFMDANTGKEITRVKSKGIKREDVTKAYQSKHGTAVGLSATLPITQLRGKKFYVLLRRAYLVNGEKSLVDIHFKEYYFTL